jgi:hypothetical protein
MHDEAEDAAFCVRLAAALSACRPRFYGLKRRWLKLNLNLNLNLHFRQFRHRTQAQTRCRAWRNA